MNICRIVTCASNLNCPTLTVVKIHGYLLSYRLKIAAKGLSTAIPNLQKIPIKSDESVMAWFPNSWTARQGMKHYGIWMCLPTTSPREHYEPEYFDTNPAKQQL